MYKCGESLDGCIMCMEDRVYLRVDFTMTLDTTNNSTEVILATSDYGYDIYNTQSAAVAHVPSTIHPFS